MKKILPLIIFLPFLFSCASTGTTEGGKIVYSKKGKNGKQQKVIVHQPQNPVSPAQIENGISAVTGSSQKHSFILEGMENKTTWIGAVLIALGIGVLGFAGYIPFLSWFHGFYIAGAGITIVALPMFLKEVSGLIIPLVIISVIGAGWMIYERYHSAKLEKEINGKKKQG